MKIIGCFNRIKNGMIQKLSMSKLLFACFVILVGVVLVSIFYKPKETNNKRLQGMSAEQFREGIKYAESRRPLGIKESSNDEEIYNNPYIKHIRIALNGYLEGTNNGVEEDAIGKFILDRQDNRNTNCGLDNFDKSYYKGKFIIYSAENNEYGGVVADIVFVDKPDTIFWTWVYNYGEDDGHEKYGLRGFCENGPPDKLKEEFKQTMKKSLEDGNNFSL